MVTVLVVGGAGFIGSHMVWLLAEKGVNVITLDNLTSGHRDAVLHGEFIFGDLADKNLLTQIFANNKFDAVMHFASYIQVGESNQEPDKYYENNVVNTLNLLNAMNEANVKRLIFSSTAAIFGDPLKTPINESHPRNPISTYGHTKLIIEEVLAAYDKAYDFRSVSLRYFNAAGAHPEGILSERHHPETHLIPLVLAAARQADRAISIFGNDYPTVDGTCIRDYIHVMDLAEAHWLALLYLLDGGLTNAFNIGNGKGYSVEEIIEKAEVVTGVKINRTIENRRSGDPAVLISDSTKIESELGWKGNTFTLEQTLAHVWQAGHAPCITKLKARK